MCGTPQSGAAALLAAFEAGGPQAQAAVAIMLGNGSCMNPAAINAAVSAFGNTPELNDPELVMRWVVAGVAVLAAMLKEACSKSSASVRRGGCRYCPLLGPRVAAPHRGAAHPPCPR